MVGVKGLEQAVPSHKRKRMAKVKTVLRTVFKPPSSAKLSNYTRRNKRAERYAKSKTNFTPTNSTAHNGFRYEPMDLMCTSLITAYQILTYKKNDATGVKNCNFRLCGV